MSESSDFDPATLTGAERALYNAIVNNRVDEAADILSGTHPVGEVPIETLLEWSEQGVFTPEQEVVINEIAEYLENNIGIEAPSFSEEQQNILQQLSEGIVTPEAVQMIMKDVAFAQAVHELQQNGDINTETINEINAQAREIRNQQISELNSADLADPSSIDNRTPVNKGITVPENIPENYHNAYRSAYEGDLNFQVLKAARQSPELLDAIGNLTQTNRISVSDFQTFNNQLTEYNQTLSTIPAEYHNAYESARQNIISQEVIRGASQSPELLSAIQELAKNGVLQATYYETFSEQLQDYNATLEIINENPALRYFVNTGNITDELVTSIADGTISVDDMSRVMDLNIIPQPYLDNLANRLDPQQDVSSPTATVPQNEQTIRQEQTNIQEQTASQAENTVAQSPSANPYEIRSQRNYPDIQANANNPNQQPNSNPNQEELQQQERESNNPNRQSSASVASIEGLYSNTTVPTPTTPLDIKFDDSPEVISQKLDAYFNDLVSQYPNPETRQLLNDMYYNKTNVAYTENMEGRIGDTGYEINSNGEFEITVRIHAPLQEAPLFEQLTKIHEIAFHAGQIHERYNTLVQELGVEKANEVFAQEFESDAGMFFLEGSVATSEYHLLHSIPQRQMQNSIANIQDPADRFEHQQNYSTMVTQSYEEYTTLQHREGQQLDVSEYHALLSSRSELVAFAELQEQANQQKAQEDYAIATRLGELAEMPALEPLFAGNNPTIEIMTMVNEGTISERDLAILHTSGFITETIYSDLKYIAEREPSSQQETSAGQQQASGNPYEIRSETNLDIQANANNPNQQPNYTQEELEQRVRELEQQERESNNPSRQSSVGENPPETSGSAVASANIDASVPFEYALLDHLQQYVPDNWSEMSEPDRKVFAEKLMENPEFKQFLDAYESAGEDIDWLEPRDILEEINSIDRQKQTTQLLTPGQKAAADDIIAPLMEEALIQSPVAFDLGNDHYMTAQLHDARHVVTAEIIRQSGMSVTLFEQPVNGVDGINSKDVPVFHGNTENVSQYPGIIDEWLPVIERYANQDPTMPLDKILEAEARAATVGLDLKSVREQYLTAREAVTGLEGGIGEINYTEILSDVAIPLEEAKERARAGEISLTENGVTIGKPLNQRTTDQTIIEGTNVPSANSEPQTEQQETTNTTEQQSQPTQQGSSQSSGGVVITPEIPGPQEPGSLGDPNAVHHRDNQSAPEDLTDNRPNPQPPVEGLGPNDVQNIPDAPLPDNAPETFPNGNGDWQLFPNGQNITTFPLGREDGELPAPEQQPAPQQDPATIVVPEAIIMDYRQQLSNYHTQVIQPMYNEVLEYNQSVQKLDADNQRHNPGSPKLYTEMLPPESFDYPEVGINYGEFEKIIARNNNVLTENEERDRKNTQDVAPHNRNVFIDEKNDLIQEYNQSFVKPIYDNAKSANAANDNLNRAEGREVYQNFELPQWMEKLERSDSDAEIQAKIARNLQDIEYNTYLVESLNPSINAYNEAAHAQLLQGLQIQQYQQPEFSQPSYSQDSILVPTVPATRQFPENNLPTNVPVVSEENGIRIGLKEAQEMYENATGEAKKFAGELLAYVQENGPVWAQKTKEGAIEFANNAGEFIMSASEKIGAGLAIGGAILLHIINPLNWFQQMSEAPEQELDQQNTIVANAQLSGIPLGNLDDIRQVLQNAGCSEAQEMNNETPVIASASPHMQQNLNAGLSV